MQQQQPIYQQAPPPYMPYYMPQPAPEKDDNTKLIVMSVLGLVGVGLVGYGIYAISGAQEQKQKDKYEDELADGNIDAQIVARLYDMIYPHWYSGSYGYGTTGKDAEALLNIASQINDFSYIKKNYSAVGKSQGRNLIDDLQTQLEAPVYAEFIRRASMKKASGDKNAASSAGQQQSSVPHEKNGYKLAYENAYTNKYVILNKPANIREEAAISNGYLGWGDNRVLTEEQVADRIKKFGSIIGVGTGKIVNDFVEVFVKFDVPKTLSLFYPESTIKNKGYTYAVKKGIKLYVHKDLVRPGVECKNDLGYISPATQLQGLGTHAVSAKKTIVYDQNMQAIGMVQPDIMLGEIIYTLNDEKNDNAMLAFSTPNGARWVDSKDTYIL